MTVTQGAAALGLVLAGIGIGAGYGALERHEERQAVLRLAPAERRQVYDGAIDVYRQVCVAHGGVNAEDYCDAQRDFIVLFAECDSTCHALLAAATPKPTK